MHKTQFNIICTEALAQLKHQAKKVAEADVCAPNPLQLLGKIAPKVSSLEQALVKQINIIEPGIKYVPYASYEAEANTFTIGVVCTGTVYESVTESNEFTLDIVLPSMWCNLTVTQNGLTHDGTLHTDEELEYEQVVQIQKQVNIISALMQLTK